MYNIDNRGFIRYSYDGNYEYMIKIIEKHKHINYIIIMCKTDIQIKNIPNHINNLTIISDNIVTINNNNKYINNLTIMSNNYNNSNNNIIINSCPINLKELLILNYSSNCSIYSLSDSIIRIMLHVRQLQYCKKLPKNLTTITLHIYDSIKFKINSKLTTVSSYCLRDISSIIITGNIKYIRILDKSNNTILNRNKLNLKMVDNKNTSFYTCLYYLNHLNI